ncbi:MAG TPA: MFS transporter [Jatrophihabitans sp.]|nr:MFS transporter [Jatrophihabitans sp.]
MRTALGRTIVLLSGGALATAGWGAVFPFLFADIADARHLGAGVAAATFTAFALGSILAAPVAGSLADRTNPVRVAVLARLALAAFTGALVLVGDPLLIWLIAAGFGASLALAQPAIQVLLLGMAPAEKRRDVFAWQFIALNLAAAAGAAVGGQLVDLSSRQGMVGVYAVAVVAALASAGIVGWAGRGQAATGPAVESAPGESVSYLAVLRLRPVRWLLAVALLITLACYAQYDAGLPAYVLKATSVQPAALGSAVALNAVLVAVLTGPVVAFTRHRAGTSLLAVCAAIWVLCWLVFGLPLFVHGRDTAFVLIGFAIMSMGETMMAPILSPLAAALAPDGAAGRTMASVTGASTIATAIGPVLSSGLLGIGHPGGFILLQVGCCVAAGATALRLGRLMPAAPARPRSVLEQLARA